MLRIPQPVLRILRSWDSPYEKFERVSRYYKGKVRTDGGVYSSVLLCRNFILKRDSGGYNDQMARDFRFIQKMRSKAKYRRFFPESQLFKSSGGSYVMVQERCDKAPHIYYKYERQLEALGALLGVSDIHSYNIGWRKTKREPVPVFIDVGILRRPVPMKKAKKQKKLSWFLPEHYVEHVYGNDY